MFYLPIFLSIGFLPDYYFIYRLIILLIGFTLNHSETDVVGAHLREVAAALADSHTRSGPR